VRRARSSRLPSQLNLDTPPAESRNLGLGDRVGLDASHSVALAARGLVAARDGNPTARPATGRDPASGAAARRYQMTNAIVTAEELESELSREDLEVMNWRFEQFMEIGFSAQHAALLALRNDVDLGRARRMVAHGCPAALALRILL
jgi:hypothetical protein